MAAESWTLDGLPLTTGAFDLIELNADPPAQRASWITAADSEAAALFRQPLHENRTITMKLKVRPQVSMDTALDRVGALVDKLRKASSTTAGVGLVWTPNDSARSVTFTVLTGEIAGLPIGLADEGYLWVLRQPVVPISLTCQPYWFGVEVLTSTNSSSTPINAFEIGGVTGDIPALGRLIITDTATQSRRHVEWGIEGPLTYNSSTSLIVDSDNMVVTGFSGVQAVTTGAYDPNASGNNSITLTPIAGATTALAGTGDPLSHVGVFRVKARVQSGSLLNLFRLSWKAGDGPMNHNTWATPISTAGWIELDLGTITIPATVLGTQRWTGQVEVQGAASSPGTVALDYLILVPQADGYGKSRAQLPTTSGAVLSAFDDFSDTAALNTKTADLGGAWATSGVATDFQSGSSGAVRTSTGIEAGPRFAVLGSSLADQLVQSSSIHYTTTSEWSLIGRWTDANNHLRFEASIINDGLGHIYPQYIRLVKVVAGVTTELARTTISSTPAGYFPALFVFASGQAVGVLYGVSSGVATGTIVDLVTASDAVLATGGTLASGKGGIANRASAAVSQTTTFGPTSISVPASEQIVTYSGRSMQVRYDDTLRQDSTGTYYGRPPSYRGSRFLLPPGTSRVLVKARRNDIETALDDQVTDATQIQVGWTPRGLAVPR